MSVAREVKELRKAAMEASETQYRAGYVDALREVLEIIEDEDCECSAFELEDQDGL